MFFYFLWPMALLIGAGYYLLWRALPEHMRGIRVTFMRELGSFFYSPIAYVCVVVFTVLSSVLSFTLGQFIEQGDASLTRTFFVYHPWIFAFVAPAIGMRLWSEEHRQGTIELLTTMPIAIWHAIVGKFLAAVVVIWAALFATLPALITIEILGDPDWGPAWSGYLSSFLLATSCLAITSAVSAFTRSQVVAFLVAVLISVLMLFVGLPPVANFVGNLPPQTTAWIVTVVVLGLVFVLRPKGVGLTLGTAVAGLFFAIALLISFVPAIGDFAAATAAGVATNFGFWDHFMEMNKGLLLGSDLIYFLSLIVFCLFTTAVVLKARRA